MRTAIEVGTIVTGTTTGTGRVGTRERIGRVRTDTVSADLRRMLHHRHPSLTMTTTMTMGLPCSRQMVLGEMTAHAQATTSSHIMDKVPISVNRGQQTQKETQETLFPNPPRDCHLEVHPLPQVGLPLKASRPLHALLP